MKPTVLTGAKARLDKLRTRLAEVRGLHAAGRPVSGSLRELYSELISVGDTLRWCRANRAAEKPAASGTGTATEPDTREASDRMLASLSAEYKALMEQIEDALDEAAPAGKGFVVESGRMLPAFFDRIVARRRRLWRGYEAVTTVFGIATLALAFIVVTGIAAGIGLPFVDLPEGNVSGLNVVACVAGCITGFCIHEFSHGIVLAGNGIGIMKVGLSAGSFIGGYVEAEENAFAAADPKVRLRFNAAGIGSNILTAILLFFLGQSLSSLFLQYFAVGNLFFGILNAFPVSPMDGGWVYEDMVSMYVRNAKVKHVFLAGRYVLLPLWLFLFLFSALR